MSLGSNKTRKEIIHILYLFITMNSRKTIEAKCILPHIYSYRKLESRAEIIPILAAAS